MIDLDVTPEQVRYIKLGSGGAWAAEAIDTGTLPFGYHQIDHASCRRGDWKAVREQLIASGRTAAGASQGVRELRDFYELGEDTLWVTLADGHLWWTYAAGAVEPTGTITPEAPSRLRRTRGGWRRTSLTGAPLTISSLSSALTRTANYRMTVCAVERADYLLRRIRGEDDPVQIEAMALKERMREVALTMIQQLHWAEFETLVDLMFARGGWRRTSLLGGGQADVDLLLDQPITGETAWVQVKTATRQSELDDYLDRFQRDGSCDRFFFICHSPAAPLRLPEAPGRHLWTGEKLADVALDVGLFDWLMERSS